MTRKCLGQYTALIYNPNVATSITSQGRASVSSMTLHFEMFLADNVKFGSLNELVEYVLENNIAYLTKKGKAISKETYELLRSVKGES